LKHGTRIDTNGVQAAPAVPFDAAAAGAVWSISAP
jgi:hypothetical protein